MAAQRNFELDFACSPDFFSKVVRQQP